MSGDEDSKLESACAKSEYSDASNISLEDVHEEMTVTLPQKIPHAAAEQQQAPSSLRQDRYWAPFSSVQTWTQEELLEHCAQHMPADKLQRFKE